jgi:MFS family permease
MSAARLPLADTPSMGAIGARLDRMPLVRFHRRLLLVIGAGLLVDGLDVYLTSGVAGALVTQGVASLRQVALLAAATTVGLGLGGFSCGALADRLGRRPTMRWTLLVVIIGSMGAALAPTIPALLAWRFVTALGLGGETVLAYAMLGEFLPPAVRGRWLARLALLSNLGMPLALFLGYFVLPLPAGWRWMLAIPGIAAIPVLMRRNLSESPRWLVTQGRHGEADAVVLRSKGWGAASAACHIAACFPTGRRRAHPHAFARGNRMRLAVGAAVCVAVMSAVLVVSGYHVLRRRRQDIASSALFSDSCRSDVLLACCWACRSPTGSRGMGRGRRLTDRGTAGAAMRLQRRHPHPDDGVSVVTAVYAVGTLGLIGYVPSCSHRIAHAWCRVLVLDWARRCGRPAVRHRSVF